MEILITIAIIIVVPAISVVLGGAIGIALGRMFDR
jgi:hypothetical protein